MLRRMSEQLKKKLNIGFVDRYKLEVVSKNITMISDGKKKVFFSYEEPIIIIQGDTLVLNAERFSQTTAGHKNLIIKEFGQGKEIIEV